MNSNKRKDETLGMPHGTANNRLRKNILFFLLKKHGENICIRCNQVIQEVEELSIEHIKPWEGISSELFWDLQNIAFSHLRCNVGARSPSPRRKEAPQGMAWCSTHQKFLSDKEFYKNSNHHNGLSFNCKECHDRQQNHGVVRGRISADSSNGRTHVRLT